VTMRLTFMFAILTAAVSATTIIPVSVDRLTSESSHVVEGRVISTESKWNPQHTLIFTYTKFEVTRTLKGAPQPSFIIKQIGGSAGGYTQKVAGVRYAKPGEESVLFLRPSSSAEGTFEITGLLQGNFSIRKLTSGEAVVSNGVPGVSVYRAGSTGEYTGAYMKLQELEARVRKAVQQ